MKFNIVYDKPGRIRVRGGRYAFPREKEYALRLEIAAWEHVTYAEVHYENGGILICYESDFRKEITDSLKKLDLKHIVPVHDRFDAQKINEDFKNDLFNIAVKHLINKVILPVPLAHMLNLIKGFKYIKKAVKTVFDGRINVDVLDGASVAACLAQKNYGTAGTIMLMLSVSALLEDYTRAKTKAALTDSLAIKTDKAWLCGENGAPDVLVPLSEIKIGDVIRVRTGCVIPVDGEVTDGEANVNESAVTGEPLSVMKSEGASVFAGTVVEEGTVAVRVRQVGGNTKIRKIIELIDSSENLKAGVQSRAESLADRIVPISFIGFGLTLALTRNVTRAVSLLMVDYSCAIKLSTPIAVISAIHDAADRDVTIKGGKYLEEFALADSIVFDKTGTLTNAEPALELVITFGNYSEHEVLTTAACIEEHFPHSVARAIVKCAAEHGFDHAEEHAEVHYIVAHGIATKLRGKRAVIGSKHFVTEDEGVGVSAEQQREIDERAGACSVVYLAIGGELVGALCISDPPRDEAYQAIELLKRASISNIVMLTGDSRKAAEITAQKLGITQVYSQVLPEDKHSHIERLKSEGKRVIMVGDGINDASDIARETADITLRGADLTELAALRTLSVRLMERINKNYGFIVAFNTMLLALGFIGAITPTVSAFLHNASTMAICAKSMLPLLETEDKQ